MKKTNIKGTYWYYKEFKECVLCGTIDTYRYRIYNVPKPDNVNERIKYEQHMCDCKWSQ
jgi:hypothetical protein